MTTPPSQSSLSSLPSPSLPGPLRCWGGTAMAGIISYGLYRLTWAIAHTFATKPVHSSNPLVLKLAGAVRTLVVGIGALGTGVFGIAALGLLALGIQVVIQRLRSRSHSSSSTV